MKKTLYSLMLNDEVVREVDALAHRLGTNRSALINQILAEYVNYTTPERRINDVLSAIEQMMIPSRELVPFFSPNSFSMSLKSSLEYKYRPTVKYEVELYRGGEESIGELSVVFRTQSAALIEMMTSFFRLWKRIEDTHLRPATGASSTTRCTTASSCAACPPRTGTAARRNWPRPLESTSSCSTS